MSKGSYKIAYTFSEGMLRTVIWTLPPNPQEKRVLRQWILEPEDPI